MKQPNLREVRRSHGLTLEQLAAKSGIQIGNLSRVERGQEFPRPARALRLAQALNLPLAQVYAAIAESGPGANASNAAASTPGAPDAQAEADGVVA